MSGSWWPLSARLWVEKQVPAIRAGVDELSHCSPEASTKSNNSGIPIRCALTGEQAAAKIEGHTLAGAWRKLSLAGWVFDARGVRLPMENGHAMELGVETISPL